MSHHVAVTLPDGRDAVADYRQPIVHVMRRVHDATSNGQPQNPADLAVIADWLDRFPEQACDMAEVYADACTGHPPSTAEPFTPPAYDPTPVLF